MPQFSTNNESASRQNCSPPTVIPWSIVGWLKVTPRLEPSARKAGKVDLRSHNGSAVRLTGPRTAK